MPVCLCEGLALELEQLYRIKDDLPLLPKRIDFCIT